MILNKADLKYTLRLLRKKPGFTLLSIVVLALGLGLSVFTFTMSYTIAYRPIPLRNGDSIRLVCAGAKSLGCSPFKAYEFAQLRDQIATLENVGIFTDAEVYVEHGGEVRTTSATRTEWNMFQLSGTQAQLGRTLQPHDHEADAEPVAVLGYEFWQLSFNGDQDVVDTIVDVEGKATRIVGVMPQGYRFPSRSQVWLPISGALLDPLENDRVFVSAFALLKNGESTRNADAEMARLMLRIRQQFPVDAAPEDSSFLQRMEQLDTGHVNTLPMQIMGGLEGLVILAVFNLLAGLVFLLACINVGTLLLARTNERMKDIAIRAALGAPRFKLLLQSMGESIAITLMGGAMALLVAGGGLELLNLFIAALTGAGGTHFWWDFRIDGSTLLAVLVFVGLTIVFTSVIPGWRLINGDFNAGLRDGTRGALGLKPGRFSRSLVTVSIALITLVLYAGVTGGSFFHAMKQSFSDIDGSNLLSARLALDQDRYANGRLLQLYRSLLESLGQHEAIDEILVLADKGVQRVEVDGQDYARESDYPSAPVYTIGGSLVAVGVTLLEGRLLDPLDMEGQQVALVSRSLADRLWPGQTAIDQSVRIGAEQQTASTYPWRRVVGVVSDAIINGNLSTNADMVYLPLSQSDGQAPTILVKYDGNADTAAALLAQAIRRQDDEARFTVRNLQDDAQDTVQAVNASFSLIFGCGLFALLIAVAGIFGLASNHVQLHTSEIGTKRALGVPDRLICRSYVLSGSRQALTGFLVAMLLCAPVTYLLILSSSPAVLRTALISGSLVATLLFVTVFLAIRYPIRKVLEMEPSEALRHE